MPATGTTVVVATGAWGLPAIVGGMDFAAVEATAGALIGSNTGATGAACGGAEDNDGLAASTCGECPEILAGAGAPDGDNFSSCPGQIV